MKEGAQGPGPVGGEGDRHHRHPVAKQGQEHHRLEDDPGPLGTLEAVVKVLQHQVPQHQAQGRPIQPTQHTQGALAPLLPNHLGFPLKRQLHNGLPNGQQAQP